MDERIDCLVRLSETQELELAELLDDCERKDRKRIDFFMESEWNEVVDCPCFFLLYIEKQLVGAVSAFIMEGEAELSALIRFDRRRKGLLSKVMEKVFLVLAMYRIRTVIFRIEDRNDVARQVLEHWDFRKVQTDCLMVLLPDEGGGNEIYREERPCCRDQGENTGEKGNEIYKGERRRSGGEIDEIRKSKAYEDRERANKGDCKKNRDSEKKRDSEGIIKCLDDLEIAGMKRELAGVFASAFGWLEADSEWIFKSNFSEGMKLWGYWIGNRVIGLCFVSVTEQGYFLSGVSIRKEEQRKGYGECFLKMLLQWLWEQERKAVFLQVSGENTVAIRLYRKLGFSVRQQLITYKIEF